jgi:hypothetical protein
MMAWNEIRNSILRQKGGKDRTIFRLLTHFSEALKRGEGLSRELIVEEVRNFENLIDAARGRVEVRTPAQSAINYRKLLEWFEQIRHELASRPRLDEKRHNAFKGI